MIAVVGVIFLLLGFLTLYRPTLEWLIRLSNTTRGVETKITRGTVLTYRFVGAIVILFGLLVAFGVLTP